MAGKNTKRRKIKMSNVFCTIQSMRRAMQTKLPFLLLLLWTGWCMAQKQYIGIDGGYAFSFRRHDAEIHNHQVPQDLRGARSYGSGMGSTVYYGYRLGRATSISLGYNFAASGNVLGDSVATLRATSHKAILAFRFEKSLGNRFSLYHQSEFIWSFYNRIVHDGNSWSYYIPTIGQTETDHWVYKETLYGRTGYGYGGSLGFLVSLTSGLKLSVDARLQLLYWAPKYSTLNACTLNGNDLMSTMAVSDKETVFEKEPHNYYYTYPLKEPIPFEVKKFYTHFHSYGFAIGLVYCFEKNKKDQPAQP
jgi:hypothetical protein